MSAVGYPSFNFIATEVRKEPSEKFWSEEVSVALAKAITAKVDPNKINVRLVQYGDNLGRIAEGLSSGVITPKGMESGWDKVDVEYLGESGEITRQINGNPTKKLVTASLVFPGQYVVLKDKTHLVVADRFQDIKDLFQNQ